MSLKNNSCFNIALYKKELRSLLWVGILASILLMFTLPYGFYFFSEMKDTFIEERNTIDPKSAFIYITDKEIIEESSHYLVGQLNRQSFTQNIILFALPILAASLVMGQDRSDKSIDLIASMPFTRKQLFYSKLFASLTICVIPYILIFLVASLLRLVTPELGIVFGIGDIFVWLVKTLAPLALLLVSGIFVGTLVSHTLAILNITPIFMGFPFGMGILIFFNITIFNVTFRDRFFEFIAKTLAFLSPAYYAVFNLFNLDYNPLGVSDFTHYVLLTMYTAVLLVASYYLYKKHKMEYSQELIIYPHLESIFIVGVSICCVLISGPLMYLLFFESLLALIPGYCLGGFVGGWIARFLVKLKKNA